jgi:hypothetical protein
VPLPHGYAAWAELVRDTACQAEAAYGKAQYFILVTKIPLQYSYPCTDTIPHPYLDFAECFIFGTQHKFSLPGVFFLKVQKDNLKITF